MTKKRNKKKKGARNDVNRTTFPASSRGSVGAFNAEYGGARPSFDTFKPWLESYINKGTPLQVLNHWKRDSYRTQARLEFTDNQHAGGIARLFALYVVGVGPRLKFKGWPKYQRRIADKDLIDFVNYKWERFADEIQFASTLRQAMQTLVVDGESFLFIAPNPKKSLGFDVQLIDSQRVGNPDNQISTRTLQDGVYLDAFGNPTAYCIYKLPETEFLYYRPQEYDVVSANQIFHLFREDLAGQTRGVSWFAAALPLLQQLREYTAAVIETAKRSAKFVSTIETQNGFGLDDFRDQYALPGETGFAIGPDGAHFNLLPYDAWGVRRTDNGDTLILPPGTTQKTFDASQPTTEASAFTNNILGQIGYSLGLPRNKATGSSHEYNFASGRLDNQPFEMLIRTLQLDVFERRCCDRLFKLFYESIEPEIFSTFADAPTVKNIEWEWVWPEPPLIDPESTARTNAIRLKSLQTTLDEVWRETHAFTEFNDVRDEIERDEREFPSVYGVDANPQTGIGDNTAIDEPKGA